MAKTVGRSAYRINTLNISMKLKELKKVLALSMVIATGVTAVPATAFAEEPETVEAVMDESEPAAEMEGLEEVPNESTDTVETPESLTETETPEMPETPETPETPEVDETPEIPEAPEADNTPVSPEVPETPETPETPKAPEVVPEAPEIIPEVPEAQTAPEEQENVQTEAQEDVQAAPEIAIEENVRPSVQRRTIQVVAKDNHRFKKVDKVYAFAGTKLAFKESTDEKAKTVGTLDINGVCFILEDNGDWYYAESGDVRGFVAKKDLLSQKESESMLKIYQSMNLNQGTVEDVAGVAETTVSRDENGAYFHTKTTTKETVVQKKYALSTATLLNVREGKGMGHRVIATLPMNTLCYVIADETADWVYIESGDVRGFVSKDYIARGSQVDQQIQAVGEAGFAKPNQIVSPAENKAWFYTTTSVVDGTSAKTVSGTREKIVEYASQYLGNPYVWGGTDPVNGADCSGFVQSIYRDFGISIPRVAEDQAYAGTQIPVEEAQPGDLIFYMDASGYIYHVVMYAGNGTTVEAMNSQYGITTGNVMADACWAVSLLDEAEVEKTEIETVAVGEYQVAFASTDQ